MLTKVLSSIFFFYKYIVTPKDYTIISEELEYMIDHNLDYMMKMIFG